MYSTSLRFGTFANLFIDCQVKLSNAVAYSVEGHSDTNLIECIPNVNWGGVHISRGVLVKFEATKEDVQAVELAAKTYEGNNNAFYSALAGNPLRAYMRDPSLFWNARQSGWKKKGKKKQKKHMQ